VNGELEIDATAALNADTAADSANITVEDLAGNLPVGLITTGGAAGTVTLDATDAAGR